MTSYDIGISVYRWLLTIPPDTLSALYAAMLVLVSYSIGLVVGGAYVFFTVRRFIRVPVGRDRRGRFRPTQK